LLRAGAWKSASVISGIGAPKRGWVAWQSVQLSLTTCATLHGTPVAPGATGTGVDGAPLPAAAGAPA
jgi:hypothetical protein